MSFLRIQEFLLLYSYLEILIIQGLSSLYCRTHSVAVSEYCADVFMYYRLLRGFVTSTMQNLSFLLLELISSHLKRSGSVQENGKGEQERIEIGGGVGGLGG